MRTSRLVNYRAVFVFVLIAALSGATSARAGFTVINPANVSTINPNDSASWSGFDVNNPSIVSTNGIKVTVQAQGTQGFTFGSSGIIVPGVEATAGGSFTQSFVTLTLDFSQPVSAVSFLMSLTAASVVPVDGFPGEAAGGEFTASAPNGDSYSFGVSPTSGNGYTAIFSTAGISSITFSDNADDVAATVAIGNLELRDSPQVASVPAPPGLTLASIGVVSLLGWNCWRRCRSAIA